MPATAAPLPELDQRIATARRAVALATWPEQVHLACLELAQLRAARLARIAETTQH